LNGIPDNANVIINAGSTLAMSAGSEVIGGLAGAGTVTTNAAVSNLNVGANNADNVFAGTLAQGGANTLSITKIGTGTQTFNGTNTATGTLTVNSGTVVLASTATWSGMTLAGGNVIVTSSQRNSGNITVNSGSTLTLADTGKIYNAAYDNGGVITVNTGGVWTMPNYSYSDVNPGVGQLSNYSARRVLGGGQIIITGDSHSSGQDFTVNAITGGTFAYNPVNAGQTLTLLVNTTDNNNINGPLNLGGSGTIVMNESMVGAGSVTKIGTGNLTLGAANTFSGGLVLGPGVVNFNHPLSAGSGTVTFGAGSTFDSTGPAGVTFTNSPNLAIAGDLNFVGTQALNLGRGAVTVTGTRTINVGGSNLTIAGNISGTGGLTKTGSGNLSLIGNNTFSGDLTVNAGTVSVGALGAANIGSGTLHLNGGGLRFDYQSLNGFTGTGTSIYTGAPASTAITDNFAVLHSSDLSNPDRIGDNTTKGFVGKVYLPAGTFSFSKNFDDQGRLVIGGTTVFNNGTWSEFVTGSFTAATAGWYDIDLRVMNGVGGIGPMNGSGIGVGIKLGAVSAVPGDYAAFDVNSVSSLGGRLAPELNRALTFAKNITLDVNSTLDVPDLGTGSSVNITGVISGASSLTKTGDGTLLLSGANTYTGDTVVSAGMLALTGSASASSGVIVNAGTLRIDAAAAVPASGLVFNGGGLQFNLGATTSLSLTQLTINAPVTIDTTGLDVTLTSPLLGNGQLNKAGTAPTPGTLTLATGSSYTGKLGFNGGAIIISDATALGAAPAAFTADSLSFNGGILRTTADVTLDANRGLTLNVNGLGILAPDAATTLTVNAIIASGTGTGSTSGKLALGSTNGGTIVLNGVNTYAGDTDLLGGTVVIGDSAALGTGANLNLPSGTTTATLQLGTTVSGTITKAINVADGFANLTIAAGTKDVTINGGLTGAGTLTQAGTGKLILGGTSAFAGGIVADNTIVLNTANAIEGGALGAILHFGTGTTYNQAGTIAYGTGVTTDISSRLDTATIPSLTIDTGANTVTFSTSLYGQFEFTKKGSGELILDGLDSFATGNLTLAAGTLTMAKQASLAGVVNGLTFGSPSSLTFTGDATLKYGSLVTTDMSPSLVAAAGKTATIDTNGNDVTFATAINGAGNFAKIGSGTLTLSATNAFTGGFKLAQGTLEIAGANTLTASTGLTFTGDATLKFATGNSDDVSNGLTVAATKTGTIDTNGNDVIFTHSLAGAGTLTKVGAGKLSLDSANTLTGTVNVNAGTLALTAFGSLDTPTTIAVGAAGTFDATAPAGFTLASGQTLTGTGAVNVDTANTLAIATGSTLNATGLTVDGKLTLAGTYAAILGAPGTVLAPNAAAQTTVGGNVTLGGTLRLTSNSAGAGAYQIINGAGTTTGNFTAFDLVGIDNALLHQVVVKSAGVTGVNLVRVATTTGTLPATIDFGNVRPGASTLSTTRDFVNTATADGFSEALTGSVSANGTGFTSAAAGSTGTVTLALDSLTAGAKSGNANVAVSSVGVGTFANTSLVSGTVALSGNVYDYGNAVIADTTVAFGNIHLGSAVVTRNLSVANTTITSATYQDNLTATATAVTGLSVNTLSEMAAGTSGNLVFSASSAAAGSLAGSVNFSLNSTNTVSGLDAKALTTTANVTTTGQVYTGLSTWNATSGSWGTLTTGFGTNWAANQGSPGLDAAFANVDTATFDNTVLATGATATVSLDGTAPSLKDITFNTTGGGYTLDAGSGGALTLAAGSGNATVTATAGNHTIATDLTLSTVTDAVVGTGAKLTLAGAVSGTVGLAKSGAGTLTIAGNNTAYTGAVTLAAGTLELNSFNAIINASALNVTGSATLLYGTGNTTDVSGKLGTIASGTTFTVDTNGNIVTYASAITSAGTLVKDNSGVLVLGAANNLTGPVNVTGGSIRIGNAGALGTSTVTVGAGSFLDLNTIDATGASIVLAGGALQRPSAYTGTVTFTAASLDASALSSAGANTKVGILTGQTAAINGETRDIELNGGTLTGLSTFTGTLIVKSTIDASATISGGAVTLAGGTVNLQGLNSTKSINYQSGTLTNANGYTGNLDVLGAVSVATGTLGNGVLLVGAGDTVTAANNGLNNAIGLSGGTVDFNGKTATSSIAYTNGTLANATGYTGDVTFSGTKSFASGSLGSARVIVATGTTLDFAAGFNNAVRNTGGAVTNGANYTGTMTYAGGQSINVTADQVAKLAFDSGTTAKGSGTLTDLSFAAGSAYTMTMKDGAGAAGVGFDSVTVTGALNLATLSSANRMTLNLFSVDSSNVAGGNIANQTFAWNDPKNFTLFTYGTLTLGNGVTNVADLFTVNYSNFKDKYGVTAQADWFSVSNDTVNGAIVLTAIPEPSTYGMSLAGLALALAAIRRRNKRKTDAEAK
jgi:autotransporter-associated beta strand protein